MNHYAFLDDIVYTYTAYEYVLDENTIKEGKWKRKMGEKRENKWHL